MTQKEKIETLEDENKLLREQIIYLKTILDSGIKEYKSVLFPITYDMPYIVTCSGGTGD